MMRYIVLQCGESVLVT